MADISKQQLRDIILKAPQGTTPQGILDALQSQGHTVEGLAQRQSTPAPQQQEKPGVVSRTASYLGKELLTGGAQRTGEEGFALGFGKDIAETTFGSRGLAGVAQLPGLVAGQLPALQSRRATAENAGQLANATTELIKRRREETNPIRKQRLTEMINSNLAQLQESNQAGQELDRFVRTPGQALGTTGNAALTLATLGTGNIATRGALSAAESLAPKALPTVQKVVTAGKSVVPRAVETGAAAAGFRAGENLSEGKPLTEDVFEAALIGAAFPVAAAGIKATFKPLKDKASQKFIDTLIKPRAVDRAYGKNPGKQIAQESIVAWTYDDLVKKIGLKKQEAGKAIEQNAQRFANEIVDVHPGVFTNE